MCYFKNDSIGVNLFKIFKHGFDFQNQITEIFKKFKIESKIKRSILYDIYFDLGFDNFDLLHQIIGEQ